jgi:hypothetical protein
VQQKVLSLTALLAINASALAITPANSPINNTATANYSIGTEDSVCPGWYRILTKLANENDKSIPAGWESNTNIIRSMGGVATVDQANYGVSSSNINWFDLTMDPICNTPFKQCYRLTGTGCTSLGGAGPFQNAYVQQDCLPQCLVSCCTNGEVCN